MAAYDEQLQQPAASAWVPAPSVQSCNRVPGPTNFIGRYYDGLYRSPPFPFNEDELMHDENHLAKYFQIDAWLRVAAIARTR